jgi:hypothetical protein
MKTPHTSTYKGKTVFIRLKIGEIIAGRFLDKKGHFVILDNAKIPIALIKSFSIRKLKTKQ